jgi:hypothetical protein
MAMSDREPRRSAESPGAGADVAREHRRLLAELRETLGAVQQSLRDHLTLPADEGGPLGAKAETVAGLVSALGTTAERLIRLERQAFGLDHKQDRPGDDDGDPDGIRRRLEGRLARLGLAGGSGGLPARVEPG